MARSSSSVARLDLVAQRRAPGSRPVPASRPRRRCCALTTSMRASRSEAGLCEVAAQASWSSGRAACARGKRGRSSGNSSASERVTTSASSLVSMRSPHVEEGAASGAPAARARKSLRLVEEHRAELADHGVERRVVEGQRHRIGLLPAHRPRGAGLLRMLEHRRVQVGDQHMSQSAGSARASCPRDDASAGRHLEQRTRLQRDGAPPQVGHMGLRRSAAPSAVRRVAGSGPRAAVGIVRLHAASHLPALPAPTGFGARGGRADPIAVGKARRQQGRIAA